jgi:hypothetical protein
MSARPRAAERLGTPDAFLSRSDLVELGLETRKPRNREAIGMRGHPPRIDRPELDPARPRVCLGTPAPEIPSTGRSRGRTVAL